MYPEDPNFWFKEVSIRTNVLTLLALRGNLLLALRHPGNVGITRDMIFALCKDIGEQLVFIGAITPEELEATYMEESIAGTPEFMNAGKPCGKPHGNIMISDKINPEKSFAVRIRSANCCACGKPMKLSGNINVLSLNKKATWPYPTWGNMLLKPGIERIKRVISVLCDECIKNKRQAIDAIEVNEEEIRYHKLSDLEDAFEITQDMVITNIKDLRG